MTEKQSSLWPEIQPERVCEDIRKYISLKVVQLVRVGEISARSNISSPGDAKEFFGAYWKHCPGNDQERFVVACLDTKHAVQSVVVAGMGTVDSCIVHPREVFKPAIIEGSSAVLLSHNHPSGNPTPSPEDHAMTERMMQAGELLGIKLLDHIIHGDGTGLLKSLREDCWPVTPSA